MAGEDWTAREIDAAEEAVSVEEQRLLRAAGRKDLAQLAFSSSTGSSVSARAAASHSRGVTPSLSS